MNNAVLYASLLPLLVVTLIFALLLDYLLRKKGYTGAMRIWAWIPIVNMYCAILVLGLPDKKLHDKIDRLLRHQGLDTETDMPDRQHGGGVRKPAPEVPGETRG